MKAASPYAGFVKIYEEKHKKELLFGKTAAKNVKFMRSAGKKGFHQTILCCIITNYAIPNF